MSEKFPHLFSPAKIGSVKIPNRLVFLPHYAAIENNDNMIHETYINYFVERAKGGTGLIIIDSHAVTPAAKMANKYIHAFDPKIVEGYRRIGDATREYGSKIFVQLSHGGHTTLYHPPQILYAPTQMSEPSCHYNTKEMEIEDLEEVTRGFAVSAKHVKEAHLDGVEIKGASHDGLLRSFISPYFNRRTDRYGGSFENRMRFPLEVVHAIREAVGPDFPLGVRICMDEFTSWGYNSDDGKRIVQAFVETGEIDYLSCDAGCFSAFYMEIPPMCIPLGFAEYLSAEIKKMTQLPVIAFGRINDPVQAERILADGNADFIGMARELVCDPEFAIKAKETRDDDIRHCIACQDGCIYQVMQNEPIRCIQNPAAGREAEYGIGTLKQAEQEKRVVVIGGGPAGLKAAEVAARRGHRVELYEEKGEIGGQVNIAARIPYREEVKDVVRYLGVQVEKLGVEVHLGERMTVEKVKRSEADVIIAATGSHPVLCKDIPGYDEKLVLTVWDVLLDLKEIGDYVVIYDITRRWPGLGTAEYLLNMGKRVDIVVPTFYVGEQLEPGNVMLTYQRILDREVKLMPHTTLNAIDGKRVTLENVFTKKTTMVEGVDTVVLSMGNRSDRELYDRLKGAVEAELYFVGDAVAPRQIQQVILEAEDLARRI